MTTKKELYKLIDNLNEKQLVHAKNALTDILQGNYPQKVPVCDLGSAEDIATLYESVVYADKEKM